MTPGTGSTIPTSIPSSPTSRVSSDFSATWIRTRFSSWATRTEATAHSPSGQKCRITSRPSTPVPRHPPMAKPPSRPFETRSSPAWSARRTRGTDASAVTKNSPMPPQDSAATGPTSIRCEWTSSPATVTRVFRIATTSRRCIPHRGIHRLDVVAIRKTRVTVAGDDVHSHRIDVGPVAAESCGGIGEFFVTAEASVPRVLLADHAGEDRVSKGRDGGFAIGGCRGTGVDGREVIRHFWPDGECAVASVRVAHDENLVRIHVAEKSELTREVGDEGIDVGIVEPVPGVIRRPERDVEVAAGLRVVAIINLHVLPLAVIDLFGRAAAAVHRDEQRPTAGRAGADRLDGVGAEMFFESHLTRVEVLLEGAVDRRGAKGVPRDTADGRLVIPKQFLEPAG